MRREGGGRTWTWRPRRSERPGPSPARQPSASSPRRRSRRGPWSPEVGGLRARPVPQPPPPPVVVVAGLVVLLRALRRAPPARAVPPEAPGPPQAAPGPRVRSEPKFPGRRSPGRGGAPELAVRPGRLGRVPVVPRNRRVRSPSLPYRPAPPVAAPPVEGGDGIRGSADVDPPEPTTALEAGGSLWPRPPRR